MKISLLKLIRRSDVQKLFDDIITIYLVLIYLVLIAVTKVLSGVSKGHCGRGSAELCPRTLNKLGPAQCQRKVKHITSEAYYTLCADMHN